MGGMKTLGEILLGYRDDPSKEALRERLNAVVRAWEESDPSAASPGVRAVDFPLPEGGEELQPLRRRVLVALPQLDAAQRRMLEALLDSWGV